MDGVQSVNSVHVGVFPTLDSLILEEFSIYTPIRGPRVSHVLVCTTIKEARVPHVHMSTTTMETREPYEHVGNP